MADCVDDERNLIKRALDVLPSWDISANASATSTPRR
jgi:hypothetical protein